MATVINYHPNQKRSKICDLGGDHESQPLNLVCLDPLCRNNPLICSTCFAQTHKYHKVVALPKFLSDYKKNIGQTDYEMQKRKINKHYGQMKLLMKNFTTSIIKKIKSFQRSLEEYASYLSGNAFIRNQVGKQLCLELDPDRILGQNNRYELQNSLKFILNNCYYDTNLNMTAVSSILKQNQQRVSALLDKMVYMTQYCQVKVQKALKNFDFASITLKQEKSALNQHIHKLNNVADDPFSTKSFIQKKQKLSEIIKSSSNLILNQSQQIQAQKQWNQVNGFASSDQKFKFGKNKHENVTIKQSGSIVQSDVTANSSHYALAWPNLNNQPQKIKQWSIKIKKCRDFASKNTMALGIGRLSDIKLANFCGSPTNTLLVTSQGFVVNNGRYQKTDFIYRQGDTVHFSYDPYYGILQVSKDNGRKLCLKAVQACEDEPLYLCARLTYASDQVQLI